MDGGAWRATIHGLTKSQTRLSNCHSHSLTASIELLLGAKHAFCFLSFVPLLICFSLSLECPLLPRHFYPLILEDTAQVPAHPTARCNFRLSSHNTVYSILAPHVLRRIMHMERQQLSNELPLIQSLLAAL